jgi:hypothetical protein
LPKEKSMNERKKYPPTALFGMFKHRKLNKPVSIEEMEAVIKKNRRERGMAKKRGLSKPPS